MRFQVHAFSQHVCTRYSTINSPYSLSNKNEDNEMCQALRIHFKDTREPSSILLYVICILNTYIQYVVIMIILTGEK